MWLRHQSRGQEARAGPRQGNYPCGFLSPLNLSFLAHPLGLICHSNKLPLCGHQDPREEQCLDELPSPSTAVLTQWTRVELQNLHLNTLPGAWNAGGCRLLRKCLGTRGESLRVWSPGDGDSGFGSLQTVAFVYGSCCATSHVQP